MRYELADYEWIAIKPMLPNKPRGVPRVNDRRVLNGIFWALRSGAPWRDLPEMFGPYTTCYNRFVHWRRAGVWGRIMDTLAAAHDAAVQMIDTSSACAPMLATFSVAFFGWLGGFVCEFAILEADSSAVDWLVQTMMQREPPYAKAAEGAPRAGSCWRPWSCSAPRHGRMRLMVLVGGCSLLSLPAPTVWLVHCDVGRPRI